MKNDRHYTDRSENDTHCEYCKKPFKKGLKMVYMLEMSCKTGKFVIDPLPEEESQGYFPIGAACYKKITKEIAK